jgi:hypothetical protein
MARNGPKRPSYRFPLFEAKQTRRCAVPSPKKPHGGHGPCVKKLETVAYPRYSASSCKSLQPQFRGKMRKFLRHFKGHFLIGNVQVRILPGQPGIAAVRNWPLTMAEKPASGGLCNSAAGLQTPNLVEYGAKSSKVSGRSLKYSRFRETAAGDRVRSTLRGRAYSANSPILRLWCCVISEPAPDGCHRPQSKLC